MSDENAGLVAGILLMGDQQRKLNDAQDQIINQSVKNASLQQENAELVDEMGRQSRQAQEVEDDYWALFNLLKQPMDVIAARNRFFAYTYEQNRLELAECVLSQLAFAELAYQLGGQLGLEPAELYEKAQQMKKGVLDNEFAPNHKTNGSDVAIVADRANVLRERFDAFSNFYRNEVNAGSLYHLTDSIPANWNSAFSAWSKLALAGDCRAQFNIGYCTAEGKGTSPNLEEAEQWYLKSLASGEPRSSFNLHLLYRNPSFSKYDLAKSKEYLSAAEQVGDPRFPMARDHFKALLDADTWKREEPDLYRQLQTIIPGKKPVELLERIKGRGYAWEADARTLHSCEFSVKIGRSFNDGSFLKPIRGTYVQLVINNPTDDGVRIYADLLNVPVVNKHEALRKFVEKKTQATTLSMGAYAKNASTEVIRLNVWDDKYIRDATEFTKSISLDFYLKLPVRI